MVNSENTHKQSPSVGSEPTLNPEEDLPAYSPGACILVKHDKKEEIVPNVDDGTLPFERYPVIVQVECTHELVLGNEEKERLQRVAIAILALSKTAAVLLLVNFIATFTGPFTKNYPNWNNLNASKANLPLIIVMTLSLLYSLFVLIHKPRRLTLSLAIRSLLEVIISANIIPQVIRLITHYPKDDWCQPFFGVSPGSSIFDGVTAVSDSEGAAGKDCIKSRRTCRALTVVGSILGIVVAALYFFSIIYRVIAYQKLSRARKVDGAS